MNEPHISVPAAPPEICPACAGQRLILTGSITKQAVYICPHRGVYQHCTCGYQGSYDEITRWTIQPSERAAGTKPVVSLPGCS